MLKKLVIGAAGSLLAVVGALVAPAPAAVAATYTYCQYGSYTAKSQLLTWNKKLVITQRQNYTVGPGYSRTTTRTVQRQRELTRSVHLSSEVSASVGNPVIGSASAKLGVALTKTRHSTTTDSKTITETVKNPTRHNVTMVFFRGHTKGWGTWRRSTCQQVSGSIGQVKWIKGKWRSFGTSDDGYVLCGQGTKHIDSMAKLAYKEGCSA